MADNIQNLLDRIQRDGVEKAQAEADVIVSKAKQEAAEITRQAEQQKSAALAQAEKDSEVFVKRGHKALQQAARDVVLSVGSAIDQTLQRIIDSKLAEAMTDDVLKQMIVKVIEAYCREGSESVEIVLGEEDEKKLAGFFMNELSSAVKQGCTIRGDARVTAGFQVSMADGHVSHDFTDEAIADALARLLRPYLAEVTREAIAATKST